MPVRAVESWVHAGAIASSINGIAYAGLDGRLTYVNDAFLRMWGYASVEEVVGRAALEFWANAERAAAVIATIGSGVHARADDLIGLRKDGSTFEVELSATLIVDPQGRPAALMGSFVDVSERVRAQRAALENEGRLGEAVRVAGLGIFDDDPRRGASWWSPRHREMFGFFADETVTSESFLQRVHPDDRGLVAAAVRHAGSRGGDGRLDLEYRIVRRDGEVRWLMTSAQTSFEGEGEARKAVRAVGATRDVTDAHRAEEERDRLREQLAHAQKLESLGRLAGGVAHDFNNALTVILGTAEVLRVQLEGRVETSEVLEIEHAAMRARDVTRQLLAFSRKQVIAPRRVDLNEELGRARQTLARLIGEDVRLELSLGAALWPVQLDPSQLDQVVMNLAINARDAMPAGGRLTIETMNVHVDEAYCAHNPGFRPGDYVVVSVSDTGVGMDKATQARIFEPFFTTKAVGAGTGLGLATVYGIATQNGGMVHVYSEPGRGSTFKVYFRRLSEGVVSPSPQLEQARVPAGHTVLLVEDDELVRRTTARMLASLGLEVRVAATPEEAITIASDRSARLDLMLTDVVMPGESGRALRDRVCALRPSLPVVFMSGYTHDVVSHHGVLEEGVRLLHKPFGLGELAAALRRALPSA